MTRKGALTRQNIIVEALRLFSVKGFYNTSIQDILKATHLTKGGLYGHFESKEEIWTAAYEEAVSMWKAIVFKELQSINDPLARIRRAIENDLQNYLGGNTFPGGCIFLNMLVELSGQSEPLSNQLRQGILGFSRLIARWLREAERKKILKPGIPLDQTADFIVIALNGCAALYASTKDPVFIDITLSQIHYQLEQLRDSPPPDSG